MGVLPYRGGSWRRLEASCRRLEAVLRVVGGVLKRLGAVLARSWGVLSASWGGLGASWGVLGLSWPPESHPTRGQKTLFFLCFFMVIASVRLLRATFAQHRLPGCTGAVLVPSWCRLGAVLARSWGVFGASWGVSGASWGVLGPSWPPKTTRRDIKSIIFHCFLKVFVPVLLLRAILAQHCLPDRLGAVLDSLFRPFRGPFGVSGAPLGPSWEPNGRAGVESIFCARFWLPSWAPGIP